jgi:endonuclease-3
MNLNQVEKSIKILDQLTPQWNIPVVGVIADQAKNKPFEVLISTILSLRTKDKTTLEATLRLFKKARTPQSILKLDLTTLEQLIYPVSFYKTKSKSIQKTCQIILDQYQGETPGSLDDLLKLPGVGRKTANLVLTLGFGDLGICVDTHVHRISNRWGFIQTQTPDESELVLRDKLPQQYWIRYNDWLVAFGQNLCQPVSPYCSRCPLKQICPQIGVTHSR